MANTYKKEKPVLRDSEFKGEDIAGDEFDDDLTEPVSSASETADDRDDERREDAVAASDRPHSADPAEDAPRKTDPVSEEHVQDELTSA